MVLRDRLRLLDGLDAAQVRPDRDEAARPDGVPVRFVGAASWRKRGIGRQASRAMIEPEDELPAAFRQTLRELEAAYLRETDPHRQSGFAGGPERWRAERVPILAALDADGDLLDVGCANGLLAASLVEWAAERGVYLTPFGIDRGAGLIALARRRYPQWAGHFFVGDAWTWVPPRRFTYVYALHDVVPRSHLGRLVDRLLAEVVAPGGRLIVGAYGSRSRGAEPLDVAATLRGLGVAVAGAAAGGSPTMCRVAWVVA